MEKVGFARTVRIRAHGLGVNDFGVHGSRTDRSPLLPLGEAQCLASTIVGRLVSLILHRRLSQDFCHPKTMKDKVAQLTASRKQLPLRMPDASTTLPGSLLSCMVRCNKPGCRFCEKRKGKCHGPIWILSVSLGNRQVRQITIGTRNSAFRLLSWILQFPANDRRCKSDVSPALCAMPASFSAL